MEPASRPQRLFIAAAVSGEIKEQAGRCIEKLQETPADAGWLNPASLHLTLRFLGSTPPRELAKLERALAGAAAAGPAFEVVFDRLGYFGRARRPQVVWAGIGRGGRELEALAAALEIRLTAEGFAPDSRPFKAHLTLGRLRSGGGAAALGGAIQAWPALDWYCPIDRLVLYSSRLTGSGAVHTPIFERPLGG